MITTALRLHLGVVLPVIPRESAGGLRLMRGAGGARTGGSR